MSATSSFVGKAIAQKVSVKSTKASTTVRASAVNKVRVARALDDARTTLSRADTRPPRERRADECHPSAHRARRPRPRTTTDRNGLFTPMRSTRALRATSRRVAHRSSSSRFPAIDRGSILRIDRGGSAIDRSNRWVTTMRGYRSKRARRSRRVYTLSTRAQAASFAAATAVIVSTTAPAFATVGIELTDKRQENQTGLQLIYEVRACWGYFTRHDSTRRDSRNRIRKISSIVRDATEGV